jgi:hypothetical protein
VLTGAFTVGVVDVDLEFDGVDDVDDVDDDGFCLFFLPEAEDDA